MASAAIRQYARQCPFVLRNSVALPASTVGLSNMASKCPIMGRALAHTQAAPKPEVDPVPNMPVKGDSEMVKAHQAFKKIVEAEQIPADQIPRVCPVQREAEAKAQVESAAQALASEKFFDYEGFFDDRIQKKKSDHSYRYFNNINRLAQSFPTAENKAYDKLTVWCSNDYLGMSRHPVVLNGMREVLDRYGAGSGGTRNISGNGRYHELLEVELADLHHKGGALVFTSCYVANDTTLQTLASMMPGCVIFSDSQNHASMIAGIKNSRAKKHIFKHNDPQDLERLLQQYDPSVPKLVAFESVYSMSGAIAPIEELCDVSHKYGALTFLDEVHAVGMYGHRGAGVAEELGEHVMNKVDIVTGTLGKAYGVIGGYIAASSNLTDMIRSYGAGFIFTTSLPPAIVAGSLASVRYLKQSQIERQGQRKNVKALKSRLAEVGIPIVEAPSHIVPVQVNNAKLCKKLSDDLLTKHHIYVQSINYPTVPVGAERLRVTPTPRHEGPLLDYFMDSITTVWKENGLKFNPY